MRLKHIKLVGFKSFVDPTTIPLPSNLVAVVGPNGCGKSNVIDAVRWVMGESSAKQLRGEAMSDVIFNGSASRKPVGVASVELEFDNSDGSLGGEYAKYTDISIKRQVTREGDSQYFLNGSRCRRRDITDIFLGTGLGPRSYAIIEQGMISRFIEAKPDDMRVYFEEVAGISKYKDRRHETELKMKHTQENLSRLYDILAELEKQLAHLEKQAQAAERYRELKQEERTFKSQLHALRWQALKKNLKHYEETIAQLETQLQQLTEHHQQTETNWQQTRTQLHDTGLVLQQQQQQHFELGADIARQQQAQAHAVERKQQLQRDHEQNQRDINTLTSQLDAEQRAIAALNEEIAQLQPKTDNTKQLAVEVQAQYFQAEQAMQNWQQSWEEYHRQSAKVNQQVQVEHNQLQHLKQRLQSSRDLIQRLQREYEQQNIEERQQTLATLSEKQTQLETNVQSAAEKTTQLKEQIQIQRQENERLNQALNQTRREVQTLIGKKASLASLQENALGNKNSKVQSWLKAHNLPEQSRLAMALQVEPGWESAVETALGSLLQAVCLEEWPSLEALFSQSPQTNLALIHTTPATQQTHDPHCLLSKIQAKISLEPLLGNIYCADTLAEALAFLPRLQSHESIMTKDGVWLGQNWVRVLKEKEEQSGILARKREIEALEQSLTQAQQQEENHQTALKQGQAQLQTLEQTLEKERAAHNQAVNQLADLKAQLRINEDALRQQQQRRQRITQELEEQTRLQQTLEQQLQQTQQAWEGAVKAQEQDKLQQQKLLADKEQHRTRLEQYKQAVSQQQNSLHQLELRLQTCLAQQQLKTQALQHAEQQLQQLNTRLATLQEALHQADVPIHELEKVLHELNQKLPQLQHQLTQTKETLGKHEQHLSAFETERHQTEQKINQTRGELEKNKLAIQGDVVRCTTLEEQLQESGHQLEQVIQDMPPEAEIQSWEQQLNKIVSRIERLGNINLAAIDELKEQQQRKEELDKQLADLNEALATLQEAIAKIDKETKTAFKDTYDKVNQLFGELFPRLFGGGAARMELTSEDLLTTGISVMAQPPGKRNSHIHLLSGGEKALTAVSLVFALFHLNPAPFCMLDEVDAPLDDANVGRFCNLVKEMSEKVQFIFISHNKLAIEMGQQLVGVTMKEPGVSRLVSVDIQKAIELANA